MQANHESLVDIVPDIAKTPATEMKSQEKLPTKIINCTNVYVAWLVRRSAISI